ncbi:MAG: hypothetical protein M1833_001790 [Piccolia ochrophora]|nr:MAG: hypothetical protein M1833_001790 [Piccolia ochrophora]
MHFLALDFDYRLLALFCIATLSFLLWHRFRVVHDPREPPFAASRVPYVGHLLGFLTNGLAYFQLLHSQNQLPAFTINILSLKGYVLNTPELAAAVHRNAKTLSFYPIVSFAVKGMAGLDKESMALINDYVHTEKGSRSFLDELHDIHNSTLVSGAFFDSLRDDSVRNLATCIRETQMPFQTSVFAWVRHLFTISTTDAVWGPGNPLRDPALEADFWTYEGGISGMALDFYPGIFVPKGLAARERLYKSFLQYNLNKGHAEASQFIKERSAIALKHGRNIEYVARGDTSIGFGIMVNLYKAAGWAPLYVFPRPTLVAELRAEITSAVTRTSNQATISVTTLRRTCPLLTATLYETIRHAGSVSTTRWVCEDTLLAERYLVKKGGFVRVPAASIHGDPAVWGSDVDEFNPHRFLKRSSAGKLELRVPASAFQGFGGGSTYCPGRNLAVSTISVFMLMMVMGYEVAPKGGKEWVLPERDSRNEGVALPKRDVEVVIKEREGWEGVKWVFEGGKSVE